MKTEIVVKRRLSLKEVMTPIDDERKKRLAETEASAEEAREIERLRAEQDLGSIRMGR